VLGEGFDEFEALMLETADAISVSLKRILGARPQVVVVQRRYASQSAKPTLDASIVFDPRTAAGSPRVRGAVKFQPQWLRATYDALRDRKSNLQLQIGAIFPYDTCPAVRQPEIADDVKRVFLACRSIIERTATAPTQGAKR
jgi:hypothetical protein